MVRVLAVNNYPAPERFERLAKCIGDNGAAVDSVNWSEATAAKFDASDGVVLSGSPDMMSDPKIHQKYWREVEAIRDSAVPILGVCFGHQMMAHAFGAKVVKDETHVLDMVKTTVLADDPLFRGLPKELMLLESRWEVVKSLPPKFTLVASSATSKIATMRHESRPLVGVQFHPERYTRDNPEGYRVVGNFVASLK